MVFAATDARPYAFALLATNFAIFAFIRWMTQHEMRQAILFGAAAAAILYFHYLFGAILPAFAIYYLVVRRHSIKADARQLAAVLISFTLLILPLIYRLLISLPHEGNTCRAGTAALCVSRAKHARTNANSDWLCGDGFSRGSGAESKVAGTRLLPGNPALLRSWRWFRPASFSA